MSSREKGKCDHHWGTTVVTYATDSPIVVNTGKRRRVSCVACDEELPYEIDSSTGQRMKSTVPVFYSADELQKIQAENDARNKALEARLAALEGAK